MKQKILIGITAPSASGKSYIINALHHNFGYNKLVSTTTRSPRSGEIEGQDYYFISPAASITFEQQNQFAELVEFNSVRYGVTHDEVEKKILNADVPAIIALTPDGIEIYKHLCRKLNIRFITLFVDTPENIRLERLANRTMANLDKLYSTTDVMAELGSLINRCKAVFTVEQQWRHLRAWDLVISGENGSSAINDINICINSIYSRDVS